MQNLRIAKVDFDRTPLIDGIEYLRRAHTRFDEWTEINAFHENVRIGLLPEARKLLETELNGAPITLEATNMRMGTILRYIAAAAGLKMEVHPDGPVIGMAEELAKRRETLGLGPR